MGWGFRLRASQWAILAALTLVACARDPRPKLGPAPRLADAKTRVRTLPPPPEWFWEPIETDGRTTSRKPLDVPIAESDVRRVEGAGRLWDELSPEARERLRNNGVLVLGSLSGEAPAEARRRSVSMGAFYTHLRRQRIPHVITLDALFSVVHAGIVQALARVEDGELGPTLQTLLEKLDTRLTAEAAGAGTELLDAYRIARGVVVVARALAATTPQALPPELAAERVRVEAATGSAMSTLLGVRLDYSRFAVPSTAARPGLFRALAWLGTAPLTLVARSESKGAPVGVAQARTNARSAMLLARLCDRDVDAAINAAYTRIQRLLSFVWGPPDDLSLTELDLLAESVGVDVTKPENIINVTRVDKLRARALSGRVPLLHDGAGGAFRSGLDVRIFGGHASADSVVLGSLVGAPVGLAQESAAAASVDRLRKGHRVLPATLDIAAWLGAPEARTLLHETGADAFDDYDAALASIQKSRTTWENGALHASVHGSLIDALIAWAGASRVGTLTTPASDRMRVESLLSAWTLVRHTGQAMARARPRAVAPSVELHVPGLPLPVFVEPMPEAIARLAGAVRQLRRGLGALAPKTTATPSPELVEIEDILRAALIGAQRFAGDERPSAEETAALASLPARIAKLEDETSEEVGPITAIVHGDPSSGRLLLSATGRIEPALVLARDPASDDVLLMVGAHLAHHELVAPKALTDASWRAQLERNVEGVPQLAPTRAGWTSAFRGSR